MRLLTIHNLAYLQRLMAELRDAIDEGRLPRPPPRRAPEPRRGSWPRRDERRGRRARRAAAAPRRRAGAPRRRATRAAGRAAGGRRGDRAAGAAAFKAFEAAGWSARAATYDALMARATAFAIAPLLDAADVGPATRVLDVGCGPGALAAAAAAARRARHRRRSRRGHGRRGPPAPPGPRRSSRPTPRHLPFADGAFDVALGAFLVNHTPDAERRGRASCAASPAPSRSPPGARRTRSRSSRCPRRPPRGLGGVPDGPDSERYAHPDALAALLGGARRSPTVARDAPRRLARRPLGRHPRRHRPHRRPARARDDDEHTAPRAHPLAEPYRTATGYELPVTILIART